ncbi:MAG: hypothetical protein JJU35_00060 [Balneolales bacterium]|nr:hypothetical protein [Balneolales bacterium]
MMKLGLTPRVLSQKMRQLALSPLFALTAVLLTLLYANTEADYFALLGCAFINSSSFGCYYLLLRFFFVLRRYQLIALFAVHLVNVVVWAMLAAQLFITVVSPASWFASGWVYLAFGFATFDFLQHFLYKLFHGTHPLIAVNLPVNRPRSGWGGGIGQLLRKGFNRRRTTAGPSAS